MNERVSEQLLDNFKQFYPMIFNEAIDFYSNGKLRVVAVMRDGSRYEYDELYSSIRKLHEIDEYGYEDLNDNLWKNQFGINLRRMLSFRGISQEELSELTGISKVSISQYTTGNALPSALKIRNIARALHCRPDDLIGF